MGGMNENTGTVSLSAGGNLAPQALCNRVYEVANVLLVSMATDHTYLFAAKSVAAESDTLVSVKVSFSRF